MAIFVGMFSVNWSRSRESQYLRAYHGKSSSRATRNACYLLFMLFYVPAHAITDRSKEIFVRLYLVSELASKQPMTEALSADVRSP